MFATIWFISWMLRGNLSVLSVWQARPSDFCTQRLCEEIGLWTTSPYQDKRIGCRSSPVKRRWFALLQLLQD